MTGVLTSHVRETDAFTLSMERDPLLRSTIVAVALFDRSPDWDALVGRIDRATRLCPTFRQRLQPAPLGLAPPRWVTDPDFDLAFHLRRIEAPPPKGFETAIEFARTAGMAAFDPARPLWEFTLIDGLTGGRAALVMKLHHSLTDGIGGVQIAAHVVDLQREPEDLGPMPGSPMATRRGPLDPWWDVIAYDLTRLVGFTHDRVTSFPGDVRQVLRDPLGSVRDGAATAAALARFVRPITTTRSQVMTERRLQWHFATLDVPLEPLKEAARHASGTLNDGFVGGIAGGLRRYHEKHGSTVDTLRLSMPISVRAEDDPEGGNRVTLVRFEVPVGIADPVERMQEIDRLAAELRHDRALPWSNTVAGVLNLLPNAITGQMLKHVDFLASNVPGFDRRIYVGGAEVLAFFPFGPTLGSAANITLMSYRDTCHVGVNTDVGAIPDPDLFLECLRDGFEEVLDLAGDHEAVRRDLA